jgi:signal transduction histidine kinase
MISWRFLGLFVTIRLLFPVALGAQISRNVLGLRVPEPGTVAAFPVEQSSSNRAMVDWQQLQRWGISEDRLPCGSIVRFRTPALWEQYKQYALSVLAVIAVLLVPIIFSVMEMRKRKTSDLAVKNLSGRLINAAEEERKRIARELHDDIGQRLSLVSFDLELRNKDEALESLHEPLEQLQEIISDVHTLSHRLHSNKLQVLGLEVSLKDVCRQLSRLHGLDIQFIADHVPFPLAEDLALCFYRVAQEALSNSVRHSGSAHVEVRLSACEGTLKMTIKDYGAGFDPTAHTGGIGLATMQERLRLVGGKLRVTSKPGAGTELTAQASLGSSNSFAGAEQSKPHDRIVAPPQSDSSDG